MKASACRSCGQDNVDILLDAGAHPISNGFSQSGRHAKARALILGSCNSCNLLQLVDPFSAADLSHSVPSWVKYNEPEAHLDEVTDFLITCVNKDTRFAGTSYIDASMIERLARQSLPQYHYLEILNGSNQVGDVNLEQTLSCIEEGLWSSGSIKFDLLIARHILDHSRDLSTFLSFVHSCLADDGLVFIEVPNSTPFIQNGDHLMLWESHANYFAESSLKRTLGLHGFSTEYSKVFPLEAGEVIVIVGRRQTKKIALPHARNSDFNDSALDSFVSTFTPKKNRYRERFEEISRKYNKIAMLGAGHMGSLFLNLFDLGTFLSFVADDDPNKKQLALPGSGLPVMPSDMIEVENVDFLLLSINRSAEGRIVERFREKNKNLSFGSIFESSPLSLL